MMEAHQSPVALQRVTAHREDLRQAGFAEGADDNKPREENLRTRALQPQGQNPKSPEAACAGTTDAIKEGGAEQVDYKPLESPSGSSPANATRTDTREDNSCPTTPQVGNEPRESPASKPAHASTLGEFEEDDDCVEQADYESFASPSGTSPGKFAREESNDEFEDESRPTSPDVSKAAASSRPDAEDEFEDGSRPASPEASRAGQPGFSGHKLQESAQSGRPDGVHADLGVSPVAAATSKERGNSDEEYDGFEDDASGADSEEGSP